MKKIIKTLLLIAFTISCIAQVTSTVPLDTPYPYGQPGVYFKDLDNQLSYWEGTWEGVVNNKNTPSYFKNF